GGIGTCPDLAPTGLGFRVGTEEGKQKRRDGEDRRRLSPAPKCPPAFHNVEQIANLTKEKQWINQNEHYVQLEVNDIRWVTLRQSWRMVDNVSATSADSLLCIALISVILLWLQPDKILFAGLL
ncbi:MAG TPA: hypothetical protein VFP43_24645, partial [Mesorhizobium sp.]|nr:hypothetical protein [Mesorhizobium sp.]